MDKEKNNFVENWNNILKLSLKEQKYFLQEILKKVLKWYTRGKDKKKSIKIHKPRWETVLN